MPTVVYFSDKYIWKICILTFEFNWLYHSRISEQIQFNVLVLVVTCGFKLININHYLDMRNLLFEVYTVLVKRQLNLRSIYRKILNVKIMGVKTERRLCPKGSKRFRRGKTQSVAFLEKLVEEIYDRVLIQVQTWHWKFLDRCLFINL